MRNEMNQSPEIGLKQVGEMNVFFYPPPPGGGGDTDQFYCVLFRERCPSGNSFLITLSFCTQTWYVSRCRETAQVSAS